MLYYSTAGKPKNPPLLLLHGFLGNCLDFSQILPSLSAHFYCITPDLPGHGDTYTEPGHYTFPHIAQALLDLLDHLDVPKTHLLGYSMGGRLALYFACEFSDHVEKVVLESTSPGLKTAAERMRRQQQDDLVAQRLLKTSLSNFLDQWYNNSLFTDLKQHPDLYTAMLQRRLSNRPEEAARALCGLSVGRQSPLWEKLASLESPLLFVVGELDLKFVAIGKEILKTCQQNRRQVTLSVFAQCGHNVHLVAPDAYTDAVIRFLSRTI
ncbi:hydrolase, alpha/beta fold family, putative [Synechococcus sp. PCC 7335]|uniref:2-succinyl-6-hydroxy-2, 4-cyclohexadiene-1-carboxylate synthase n=1 Tax=Synechococcus sp. (strain ATCC 29403 / PCC 7335) TaxID=91464 RepID=UPI00017EB897|nr:2-succinyl-6-hydroxy-2,4-cyclohexadiene-1-carboxylate synthase [Synechococcus sp. PCC 7335]EDX86924.1 hydrolase, alpha/beta fold family, putative [Synechococcus sp. PCC 7335]